MLDQPWKEKNWLLDRNSFNQQLFNITHLLWALFLHAQRGERGNCITELMLKVPGSQELEPLLDRKIGLPLGNNPLYSLSVSWHSHTCVNLSTTCQTWQAECRDNVWVPFATQLLLAAGLDRPTWYHLVCLSSKRAERQLLLSRTPAWISSVHVCVCVRMHAHKEEGKTWWSDNFTCLHCKCKGY